MAATADFPTRTGIRARISRAWKAATVASLGRRYPGRPLCR